MDTSTIGTIVASATGLGAVLGVIILVSKRIVQPTVLEEADKRYARKDECIATHQMTAAEDNRHGKRLEKLEDSVEEVKDSVSDIKVAMGESGAHIEWIRDTLEKREKAV